MSTTVLLSCQYYKKRGCDVSHSPSTLLLFNCHVHQPCDGSAYLLPVPARLRTCVPSSNPLRLRNRRICRESGSNLRPIRSHPIRRIRSCYLTLLVPVGD